MAGGYLQDRFVQGVNDCEAYRFYHWQYLDTFIYFSHYFVSVPPPCWVNAAHRHGVKILGTLITEWDDGKERCEKMLKSESSCIETANTLVDLTLAYKLDGWLINIENVIKEEQVENLVTFIRHLTEMLKSKIRHSQVLWYDSVTCEGKLKWQDQLNDLNVIFFNASDAIFLNYGWDKEKLKNSSERCRELHRPFDVYVGVDVWGRGCFGGGGFETNLAMEAARDYKLSAAIFAQGWVYEKLGKEHFTANENKFWGLLDPYLSIHSYTQLPFSSTFCQGCGSRFYVNGEVVSYEDWLNLTCQSVQPSFTDFNQFSMQPVEDRPHKQCMEWYTEDAYTGGGCLKISGLLEDAAPCLMYKLFSTNIEIAKGSFLVYFTFKKLQGKHCDIELHLNLKSGGNKFEYVLCGTSGNRPGTQLTPLGKQQQQHMINSAWVPVEHARWVTWIFVLESTANERIPCQLSLEKISVVLRKTGKEDKIASSFLLGQIQIMKSSLAKELPLVTNQTVKTRIPELVQEKDIKPDRTVVELSWTFPENTAGFYLVFMRSFYSNGIKANRKLLGQTDVCKFIASFESTGDIKYVLFYIQPVLLSGFVLPIDRITPVKYEID